MDFEEWYDQHFGTEDDKAAAKASAATATTDPERLDYAANDTGIVGSAFQSLRDAPGWTAKRIARGINPDLPPARNRWDESPFLDPSNWGRENVGPNIRRLWNATGEGPSAREQEFGKITVASQQSGVSPPPPPFLNPANWSLQNPARNLRDILPPGFSVQRGLDSALAPAKWLFNEVRQGVLPDEALQEIKRDPYSPESLAAYAQAAISLSGGKGGPGERGAVPEHIWNSWKPLPKEPGKTYIVGQGGEIRTDPAGNHFQLEGAHHDESTGQTHMVVKPVEAPGSGTTMTPSEVNDMLQKLHAGDDPFSEFLKEQYPEGTSGMFKDPATLPPAELSKGPYSPDNPEPGSILDLWSKKHDNLLPTPGTPSSGAPPPGEPPNLTPYNPRMPLDIDSPDSLVSNWLENYEPPPINNYPKEWDQMSPEAKRRFINRWQYKPPPEHGGNNL